MPPPFTQGRLIEEKEFTLYYTTEAKNRKNFSVHLHKGGLKNNNINSLTQRWLLKSFTTPFFFVIKGKREFFYATFAVGGKKEEILQQYFLN